MSTISTPAGGGDGFGTVRGPTLATRLGASWKVDIWPTLWGVAVVIAILLVAPVIIALLVPVNIVTVDIMTTSAAETFAATVVIAAVIAASSASTGRREALLGGWTRRDRVQVTAVLAIGAALGAAVVWLVVAALALDPRPLLALVGRVSWMELMQPTVSALAALIVAAIATMGVFVPSLLVALARIHWLVVTLGSIVLAGLVSMLGVAYGLVAYPVANVPADAAAVGDATLATVSVTTGLVGAVVVVAASVTLTLRAPIERYR